MPFNKEKHDEELGPVTSYQDGAILNNLHRTGTHTTYDAVFGEISEDGPNYRNVCIAARTCLYDGHR